METLVLIIAILILLAGIALWRADKSVNQSSQEVDAPSVDDLEEHTETPTLSERAEPEHTEAVYAEQDVNLDAETEASLAEIPEVSEHELIVEDIPVEQPEEHPEELARSVDKPSFLHSLTSSQRRERKHWAAKHGFDFLKEDAFLTDEWCRGAAATGAVAREVVSGMAQGYEMHLVDLAGVPVMAMRRGTVSEVVIDARRNMQSIPIAEDLVEVTTVSGFRLLSNTAGVAQRFVDERVQAAMESMPDAVIAVWLESDWVLAETIKGSTAQDWEGILTPLALLTDASFTLPPASSINDVDLSLIEPTRLRPETTYEPEEPQRAPETDLSQPLVIRPEEPLQMPVRAREQNRGVVEPRSLGADHVETIAEGMPTTPNNFSGTRVLRDLSAGSKIFDDSAES